MIVPVSREERMAANENVFRRVNERVEDLATAGEEGLEFVCECANIECSERVLLSIGAYEDVRSAANRFVVRSGHERPRVERVLDQGNGYVVVEKLGEAGESAAEDDPRSA
jgi:hypothetical protein